MLIEVLVPVTVFTTLILALTVMVWLARRGLEPTGSVLININSKRSLEVRAGERLLFALAEHGIYLPAACGGRGSCGQCLVTVTEGSRPLLPTEEPHIGATEAAAGVRLACMLKILDPISVRLEETVLSVQRLTAIVESNRSVATYLKELVLRPEFPLEFEAGDYLLVEAPPYRIEFSEFDIDTRFSGRWNDYGLFKLKSKSRELVTRAYSLANPPGEQDRITLVIRIALPPPTAPIATPPGCVSSFLFGLKPGDSISLRGPYGDFHVQDTDREMVFIGGGAGVAPLRSMILDQLETGTKRRMSFWYGALDVDDLCYVEEFRAAAAAHENFSYHVALSSIGATTDWDGSRGFIHAVAHEQYLQDHPAPESVEYYLCGPPLMSAAALQMLEKLGVPAENVFFDDFGT
jgi:Na+-transporting NADH:ubiquinone oxidoreductase subunit F